MTMWKKDMDAEIAYLREALERSIKQDTEWSRSPLGQQIMARHRAKLAILDSEPGHKEYENDWRLFSATLDYAATGEGRTMIFMAEGAPNMKMFLHRVCGEMSGFYAIGVDLWDGLPPASNPVFRHMVSSSMANVLESDIEDHEHWGSGNVSIYLEQHS